MIVRSAGALALVLAVTAGAPVAPASAPAATALRYYAQDDASAQLVGLQLSLDAGLDRQTDRQNGLAALTAETVLATPVGGVALRDAVAARGASITATVGTQYARFYLEGSPEAVAAAAELTAHALAGPDISNRTLAVARAVLRARIADNETNPVAVGIAMLRESYYEGGAGLGTSGTLATLANLGPDDVRAFIAATYRRAGATVTAVGRVTPEVTSAGSELVAALGAGALARIDPSVRPISENPKRIVTQRDIGVPYVVLGFAAPDLGSKDFAAMLVLRSLISDVFDRQSATTLPVYSRGVGALYNYDVKPASFDVYINGGQIDPSQGLGSVDAVLRGIATKPLTDVLLKRYRSSAHGEWVTEAVSLEDRAGELGTFLELGVGPDYGATVLSAIDGVTGADVQRVAKTYLSKYTLALVTPRDRPDHNG